MHHVLHPIDVSGLRKSYIPSTATEYESWGDVLGKHASRAARRLFGRLAPKERPVVALDGVDLRVRPGELFGLVGPNGAGKTTLLKCLSALVLPDAGGGTVNGYDILRHRREVRATTTLVKGGGWTSNFWYLSLRENLEVYARLCGLPPELAKARIDEALDLLDLAPHQRQEEWHLSSGQRQKAALAKAFVVRTRVMLLDEPTVHLDVRVARAVRSFLREVVHRRLGVTVLMSTHYLEEAEALCDRLAVLRAGRVVALGTPEEIRTQAGAAAATVVVAAVSTQGEAHERRLLLPTDGRLEPLLAPLVAEGLGIRRVHVERPSLEEAFLRLMAVDTPTPTEGRPA